MAICGLATAADKLKPQPSCVQSLLPWETFWQVPPVRGQGTPSIHAVGLMGESFE